jgi:hypothetical protein
MVLGSDVEEPPEDQNPLKEGGMDDRRIRLYGKRVGYTDAEMVRFAEGGHRVRQVNLLSQAAPLHSIEAEVVESRNCNSGHVKGQKIVMDVDGNLVTALCPKKLCVYLVSQLTIPVALINERLGEGLEPNDFHFMRTVQCPDAGVDCMGYGRVTAHVRVVPRERR